jgi:DNA polymerase-4
MALRYLFIDFDSFFASVEQQFQPQLRGRPVGVVPSLGVDTTCCIAASYEAKAHGVKTGTGVREARYLCPGIQFVEGNHARYIKVHNAIRAIIHEIIYVDAVLSIDEMYGRLPPHWQSPALAHAKAREIKAALRSTIGPYVGASIGLAPNRFLAKLASKLEKPDGLTTLDFDELPDKLYSFELEDITGIGRRMQQRLRSARITTVEALCQAPRHTLRRIWSSVEGERMWYALRGMDLGLVGDAPRRTVGHSHVLPPALRSVPGAHATVHRMLQKVCRRLRAIDTYAGELELQVKFGFDWPWRTEARLFPTQDDVILGKLLNRLWRARPSDAPEPTKVGIRCSRLVHGDNHTPCMFAEGGAARRARLQSAMDAVNKAHGCRSLYYAEAHQAQRSSQAAPMRVAFTHIPDLDVEGG